MHEITQSDRHRTLYLYICHFLGFTDDIIMQMTKNRTFAFVHEFKVKEGGLIMEAQ